MDFNPANMAHVPAELTGRPQWVLWRLEDRGGKPTKVPYHPEGFRSSSSDSSTWSTFGAVRVAYTAGRDAGLGFVFSADDSFCGVDLDHCRNPRSGEIDGWAREVIERLDSYTEVSPSLTGVKVFVKGESPFESGKNIRLSFPAFDGSSEPTGIEVYDSGRYFAVTGKRMKVSETVNLRQDVLSWIADKFKPEVERPQPIDWESPLQVLERARKYIAKIEPAISGSGGHNQTFKVACILSLGFGLKDDEAYTLLDEWNQRCQPVWSERELRHKISDAARQGGARNYLRNTDQTNWHRIEVPPYSCPEPAPKGNFVQMKDAMLASFDPSAKQEQLLQVGIEPFDRELGGGIALGELALFAARPSHGKSAVGLQACHTASADGWPCAFFSEEMSIGHVAKRGCMYSEVKTSSEVHDYFRDRAPWFVIEPCNTLERMICTLDELAENDGVKLAVIDYAQLVDAGNTRDSRYNQTTEVSKQLHNAAIRHNMVVIALCQMSRGIESRPTFTPKMSDLKESGQLEQDADVLAFLVWPWRVDSRQHPSKYQMIVEKNRNRGIREKIVECEFDPRLQKVSPAGVENMPNYSEELRDFNDSW